MSNTIKVKVGMEGVESVEQGFKRIGAASSQTFQKVAEGGTKLDRTSRDLNKFGQALGELGGTSLMTAARQLDNLTDGFQALRESLKSVNFGVMAAGAAAIGVVTMAFQEMAEASENASRVLKNLITPGTDLFRETRKVSSEEERTKLLAGYDKEINRLADLEQKHRSRYRKLTPGSNALAELQQIQNQLNGLRKMRETLVGQSGEDVISRNQLTAAEKESTEWLEKSGHAMRFQIEAMELSAQPLERQIQLLKEQREALAQISRQLSPTNATGEKALLEIRHETLELNQQIAQKEEQLAQIHARDATETKRQVKEVNDEWQKQIQSLDRIGEQLQRQAQLRQAVQAQMTDFARGSTYAGASADAYGQHRLNGMTEQAYGMGGMGAGAIAGIQNAVTMLGTTASQVGNAITSSIGGALDGISSSIEGLIRGTMTWADAFRNVGMAILNSVVTAFAKMIAQMLVSFILQKVFGKAMQQQAIQVGSAWTSAAISASIASYGTAAGVGLGAFLAAQAAGQAATVGMSGFASGGFTGNQPTNAVAGVVHGGEFVFSAPAVRRVGLDNLEAMHEGATGGAGASAGRGGLILVDSRRTAEQVLQEKGPGWVIQTIKDNRSQIFA